jgi:hypothetical protein
LGKIAAGGAAVNLFAAHKDAQGRPLPGAGIIFGSDGLDKLSQAGYWKQQNTAADGWWTMDMLPSSTYFPDQDPGPRGRGPWCWFPYGYSDIVVGGGLPYQWHVSAFAVWQDGLTGNADPGDPGDGGSLDLAETNALLRDTVESLVQIRKLLSGLAGHLGAPAL